MKNLNVAIIGKIDHGRTLFASMLAKHIANTYGKDMSLEMNDAATTMEYVVSSPICEYRLIDLGRYGRFKNMLQYSNIDNAIVVVNALEGVTGQLHEQLLRIRNKGVESIAVFLNGCENVISKDDITPIVDDIKETAATYGYVEAFPIVCGSALLAKTGNEDAIKTIALAADWLELWAQEV